MCKRKRYIGTVLPSVNIGDLCNTDGEKMVPFGPHDLLNDQSTFGSPPTRFDHPVTMWRCFGPTFFSVKIDLKKRKKVLLECKSTVAKRVAKERNNTRATTTLWKKRQFAFVCVPKQKAEEETSYILCLFLHSYKMEWKCAEMQNGKIAIWKLFFVLNKIVFVPWKFNCITEKTSLLISLHYSLLPRMKSQDFGFFV